MNTEGITTWVLQNIIPVLLLIAGVTIIATSKKGRWSDAFGHIGLIILGLVVIVGAGALVLLAEDITAVTF